MRAMWPGPFQPPLLYPPYQSTILRAPSQPLIRLPRGLHRSERAGLRLSADRRDRQRSDAPARRRAAGRAIIVTGRVVDEDGRPVPHTLIEIWQCNAAGRYPHARDDHPAPLDPNFTGARPDDDRRRGPLPIHDDQAGRLPVAQPPQRLAAGAHPFLAVRDVVSRAAGHADVLPERPAVPVRPDLPVGPGRAGARAAGLDSSTWR